MALENKKSILQPQSVEAQQFRLKNSNLAARLDQSISISNQQSSAVGATSAKPSVLAPSTPPTPLPAESNATVSSTVPGGSPTPVPSPANPAGSPANTSPGPSAPTQEIVYKTNAAHFDGNFYFTASNPDLGVAAISGSKYSYGIMFKTDDLPAGASLHPQTLFHTYSGSAQSNSIDLSILEGGNIALTYKNSGGQIQYKFYSPKTVRQHSGKQGNGYTYVQVHRDLPQYFTYTVRAPHRLVINGENRPAKQLVSGNSDVEFDSFDISDNDHFYIGGTAAQTSSNFSGSIAWMTFDKWNVGPKQVAKLLESDTPVTQPRGNGNAVRSYTFTDDPAAPFLEWTGSVATTQVSLGLNVHSSSYAYRAGRE